MAQQAGQHVRQLASDVASSMSKIVSSMNQATDAAHRLANAINQLHDKEITVTTHFVTTGAAPQAAGMNEIVRGPQLLLVGEAGPERVQITPLQRAATTSTGIYKDHVFAAAKGLDTIVHDKLDSQAISNFAGERGMRIDEFKEDQEKGVIDVEVRKVYKSGWIDKDDWKDFAKEYGYRVSDFDKKKNGKLADIAFKRMKGYRYQELDPDFDEEMGEPARKKVDWGTTRGRPQNLDEGGVEGAEFGGGAGGGGGGGAVATPGRRVTGGGGGGTTGGGGFNRRTDGTTTVYMKADFHIDIDGKEWIKKQRELELNGYMATK